MAIAGADPEWLDSTIEEIVDPDLVICDAHHHLWDHPGSRYLLEDLHADAATGHRVETTVFVECGSEYRSSGPEEMKPVGEIEFVAEEAHRSTQLPGAEIRGIIGYADTALGEDIDAVLDAQVHAGEGRFRGIRHAAAWDSSGQLRPSHTDPPARLLRLNEVRTAVNRLGKRDLTFDAWVYFTQIDDVCDLAKACPHTIIVLDHLGGPVGIGPFATERDEVLSKCRSRLRTLSEFPNVVLKLGGIGMSLYGDRWSGRRTAPSSDDLVERWGPQVRWCLDRFGADRCMFESNFPVDRAGVSYHVLWNAFKKMVDGASDNEKRAVFNDTATRIYRLNDDVGGAVRPRS